VNQRAGDFGPVHRLEADAVGSPGRRAFRIIVGSAHGTAWLRVERQQVEALAMLIEQLLTGLPAIDLRASPQAPPDQPARTVDSEPSPTLEFRVGQLALGYDESQEMFVLLAHDVESDPDGPAEFSCLATRPQLRHLAQSIGPLLAGGRPRCPFCEAPLGSEKHVCPRANGHASHAAEN